MYKKLFYFGFSLFCFANMNAQTTTTTIFEENFDDISSADWPSADWKQYNLDGKAGASDPFIGDIFTDPDVPWQLINGSVASISYLSPEGQADRWLTSPEIDLTKCTDTEGKITLTYNRRSGDFAYPDSYKLYVSTTGIEVEDFGTAIYSETVPKMEFDIKEIDLSEYAGKKIHLAWQHDTNNEYLILLDDIKVTYEGVLSIPDEFFKNNFSIYPNPVGDILNIESKNGIQIDEVRITDLTGKIVKSQQKDTVINTSDLSAGVYLIDLKTEKGRATSKIIKK